MRYTLLLDVKNASTLQNLLEPVFNTFIADNTIPLLKQITDKQPQLLIIGADQLLENKVEEYHDIKRDKVYYDFPVIAICDNLSDEQKLILYGMDIKGLLEESFSNDRIIDAIIHTLSRSNPYVGTVRDRFVKAFIGYEDAYNYSVEMLYMANYLINYYNIDPESASNIRLAVIFLSTSLKKKKSSKIMHLLRMLNISDQLMYFMEHYDKAHNLEEQIILASIFSSFEQRPLFLRDIDAKMGNDIKDIASDALENNKIYIASKHDIFYFCHRINRLFGDTMLRLDISEYYLDYISNILTHVLAQNGIMLVAFNDQDPNVYSLRFTINQNSIDQVYKNIEELTNVNQHVKIYISEDHTAIEIYLDKLCDPMQPSCNLYKPIAHKESLDSKKKIDETTENTTPQIKPSERKVDTSVINNMHYEDHHKISATQFLQEFEYDAYLIDDLLEDENEARDRLSFEDGLSPLMMESITKAFEHYTHLLNETIEFRDLAYSLSALVELLNTFELEPLTVDAKKMLKIYLLGIIDNLTSWRTHIFIQQSSQDIHYLDASLLNDCAQIEALINPSSVSDDESDLEFF